MSESKIELMEHLEIMESLEKDGIFLKEFPDENWLNMMQLRAKFEEPSQNSIYSQIEMQIVNSLRDKATSGKLEVSAAIGGNPTPERLEADLNVHYNQDRFFNGNISFACTWKNKLFGSILIQYNINL